MSTLPPNHQPAVAKASPVNTMAAASTKSKSAKAAAANANATTKQKNQHRRSRTGCYTCRLRRKKCDEGQSICTACKHLGLTCEYKRPSWWSNNETRRQHKDDIKMIIKKKKQSEKGAQVQAHAHTHAHAHPVQTSLPSPPGLSHSLPSLPTSATFSDPLERNRSASIDSQYSFNFNSPPTTCSEFGPFTPQLHPEYMFSTAFAPYEIDIKTERQMYVNDIPTLKESTTSTFSTCYTPPPPGTTLPSFPLEGEWTEQVCSERRESFTEETLNTNFFDFAHATSRQVAIELDESDQRLLDHFIQHVLPTIFPILEANQHGSVTSDLILPALQSNKGYLHCCLSIAAQHLKAATGAQSEEMDADIMRHRYATISALCDALNRDENHQQILEAALGLIFFQCCVGRFDDALPDIAWHQHFQAAVSLVQKLDLPRIVSANQESAPAPFNMTLTSWIDILGATMQGCAPTFAHTYREKLMSADNSSIGLRELMGCEDRVMYLISEIACLESLKNDGMDDISICHHVQVIGDQIGLTEAGESAPKLPFNANGTLSPKQLSKNITAAFRLAARIYLCSLVPGFSPTQQSCIGLVDRLTAVLQQVPSGPNGFDRSLVWVYLVGGSVSQPGSSFRAFIDDRIGQLGELANLGSFGRVTSLLRETWAESDQLLLAQSQAGSPASASSDAVGSAAPHYIHWRDVMQMKGWDYLLI